MHRIDTPTAQKDKFGEGKNGFTGGNPQTGEPPTALNNDYFDAIQEELAVIVEATGVALDKTKHNQIATALKKIFLQSGNRFSEINDAGPAALATALLNLGLSDVVHAPQLTGIIGETRNAKMSVTATSATATFTADEIIVGTALGGLQYRIGNFNKTINLATKGAGGMDAGTPPASGFVGIYAIINPTSGASALLAVNATTTIVPEVYGGANMPSGYTASALVSVWATNASGQFKVGIQAGRNISSQSIFVLNTSGSGNSNPFSSFTIATAAP